MSGIDGPKQQNGETGIAVCDHSSDRPAVTDGSRFVRLTSTQRDLYLYEVANPDSTTFNIGVSVGLGASLDPAYWEKAVTCVVRDEEIASTCFVAHRGEVIQQSGSCDPLFYFYVDLRDLDRKIANAEHYLSEQCANRFDLGKGPLIRNYLVKDHEAHYTAAILMPHILLDGMAAKAYLEQVGKVYEALQKKATPAPSTAPEFFDYVECHLAEFDCDESRRYWTDCLQEAMPLEFAGTPAAGATARRTTLRLDRRQTAEIKQFCRQQGSNLPAFFMSLYAVLLRRYADCNEDIVVLSVLSGRPRQYLRTLGCFYQVLPYLFPGSLAADTSLVSDLLRHVTQYRQDPGKPENVSMSMLEKILPAAGAKCFYNYQSFATFKMLGEKRTCQVYMNHPHNEVHLAVTDCGSNIMLELYFHENRFPDLHFLQRLGQLARQSCSKSARQQDLDILLDVERNQLRRNKPTTGSDSGPGVQQRFEAQAQLRPEAVAITLPAYPDSAEAVVTASAGDQLEYAELNRRANQLAHQLQQRGVVPETLVAVLLDRSAELVIAILAVIKAGGAYVPIDPDYPDSRISFILKDCGAQLLITQQDLARRISDFDGDRLLLDEARELIARKPTHNPACRTGPDNLAYVIYTSGSTGTPKGVLVTHGNLARLLTQTEPWFHFDEHDVWTLFHSCAFDFSVWEFWGAMVHGGRLVIIPTRLSRSPEDFYRVLQHQQVTVLNQTPSAFFPLMRVDERKRRRVELALRYVIFGGETLTLSALESWVERHGDNHPQLFNMYGITETTVHVTCRRLLRTDIINARGSLIGRPLADLNVILVDSSQRPVPPGLPGEICVSGAGVARGYHDRPQLNRDRFVSDPIDFTTRAYRSGDQGRLLVDGEIEYLGRIDNQVKIRGFRIEPGEIETILLEHPDISAALVVAQASDSSGQACEQRLVAYVVARGDATPSISQLRTHLAGRLPEYMQPAAFVSLSAIPLTSNGKVDRNLLPLPGPERPTLKQAYVAPQGEHETSLARLIESVLGVEGIGRHDDFFDLGGNSLAVMQLAASIWEQMGVSLPFYLIFHHPTLKSLAELIVDTDTRQPLLPPLTLKPAPRSQPLPLSFSQERVWFLLQLDPANRAYEFHATIRFTGELDHQALQQSLNEIVARHEIYRTSFALNEGKPRQFVHAPWPVDLVCFELDRSGAEPMAAQIEKQLRELAREPFAPGSLPLVRWALLKLDKDDHILLHCEHHLLHDGWSFVVFLRELLALYLNCTRGQSVTLAKLPIQFADYAYWHRQWMQQGVAEAQLAYWQQKLSHSPPLLELPTDYPRPARSGHGGDALRRDFNPEFSTAIKKYSRDHGTTMHMTLFAAFVVLLSRYTGETDIVVGTGIANRRWRETENMMGMLLNNVALRIDLSDDPSIADLLHRVCRTSLEAYDYQDVPFDQVVEAVNPPRSANHSPIFQTLFTSYDGDMPSFDLPGLSVTVDEGLNLGTAKFDLNVVVICRDKSQPGRGNADQEDIVSLIWEYSTELFASASMERMMNHYRNILDSMLTDSQQRVSALPLLSDTERQKLLVDWNQTASDYPRDATVHGLFEQQAQQQPDVVAVEFEAQRLSYAALNRRANQLAHRLKQLGVGAEVPVAICLERSLDLIVGLLGILKAGGAYLPLDPGYPDQRLQYMLADSGTPLIVTREHLRKRLCGHDAEILAMDTERASLAGESDANLQLPLCGSNLAYIAYTSGSTGKPKGTCIEHRNVVRLVHSTDYISFEADQVFLQFAPISFDASTFELWGSLLQGARLVVFPNQEPSLDKLAQVIQEHGVTTLWLSAGLFHQMVDEHPQSLGSIRQLLAGGEALSVAHVKRAQELLGENARLINGYGPTEGTTFSCCYPMTAATPINHTVPIGRPIANTRVYVLDTHLQPVPIGVTGELYIGGDGLAREYLNQPAMTAEVFVASPFPEEPGERLYRSGDLVRYREDGIIEFMGRRDKQIKFHGFRIEPGEVETALVRHPQVRDAVLLARDLENGDKRLTSYLVAQTRQRPSAQELRGFLADELPQYLLPSAFVWVDSWPLTANGKLDVEALPEPDESTSHADTANILPRSETEKTIAALWLEVLPLSTIGVHDDFFVAGGHSLMAGQLMNRLRDTFGLEIPMRCLFDDPTVAGLAAYVEAARTNAMDHGHGGSEREQGRI